MNAQDQAKRKAAEAALRYIIQGEVLGVGTGSTVNHLIDLIGEHKLDIPGAVSSSEASTAKLKQLGIPVLDLNNVGSISVYIDGADEANRHLQLIKGGGAALTREKIIAGASRKFVCIVDESKLVTALGKFPVPIEVLPMARSFVAREIVKLGGKPELREGVVTDNGNPIIDVRGWTMGEPLKLEAQLSLIPGVVTAGIFAHRPADLLIVGGASGTREMTAATS